MILQKSKFYTEILQDKKLCNKIIDSKIMKELNYYSTKEFSSFNLIKFPKLRSRLNKFSLPSFESGALKLIEKVFPNYSGKISQKVNINAQAVRKANHFTVDKHKETKQINYSLINNYSLIKTINSTNEYFSKAYVDPYFKITDLEYAMDLLPHNTSSCYPKFIKKGNVKAREEASKTCRKLMNIKHPVKLMLEYSKLPSVVFNRFTPKLREVAFGNFECFYKIRQIFGVPFSIVLTEVSTLSYFVNNFKRTLKGTYTSGLTRPEISKSISDFKKRANSSNKVILCGDISKCDQSIPKELILFLFHTWASQIQKFEDRINLMGLLYYHCNTPIISHETEVVSFGSNTSGSWITNIINTFSLLFILNYYNINRYNKSLDLNDILVQGDDFILMINNADEIHAIKDVFSLFGLTLHKQKSKLVEPNGEVEFLGFIWDSFNEPYQNEKWIIARILFPERYVEYPGPDRIISRYLSIIFQLRNSVSLFKRFLSFDPYLRLKLKESINPVFNLIDSMGRIVKMVFPILRFLNVGWRMF